MTHDRSNLPEDFRIESSWGRPSDPGYEVIAERFRPVFERIRANSIARELGRVLPFEEIGWLKEAGFTTVRLPLEAGGGGVSLSGFFALLIELSAAESNLTQALRVHFGFVEHVLTEVAAERKPLWFERLGSGAIAGGGWSEVGDAKQARFSTQLRQTPDGWRLTGSKFYTTGTLYADWVQVGAGDAEDRPVSVIVRRDDPGVEVVDDWDGMGQRLTASGTTHFRDVPVDEADIVVERSPFAYSEAFYQLVHLATLAGIGRAAAIDAAAILRQRRRSYSTAPTPVAAEDPQLLQVIGRLGAQAYAAGATVHHAAAALDRAAAAVGSEHELARIAEAELEIWQAQTVVSQLVLDGTASVFDALGASATLRTTGLDRYWRNARTITSHNPRVYKDRIVGDFLVNGRIPPGQWRIGEA